MTKKLTVIGVENIKATEKAQDIPDGTVAGMILRIRPSGAKSYALVARFPGSKNPTRRTIGRADQITLVEARKVAREWHTDLARGIDPANAVARRRAEPSPDTFEVVALEYIKHKAVGRDADDPNFRRADRTIHNIRDILIPLFGHLPVGEITPREVAAALRQIEEHGTDRALVNLGARKRLRRPNRAGAGAPEQARMLFVWLHGVLRWAAATGAYGLVASPLESVSPTELFGEMQSRERVLTDEELAAVWRATERLRAPYRQLYRMLMLTGLRLSEVRRAQWGEFDLRAKQWTIPALFMKGKKKKARSHRVPLTDHMLAVLKEIPHGSEGDFAFSCTGGATAICAGGDFKTMLDDEVAFELRVREAKHFTNHDIRRTMRTRGRELRFFDTDVGEAILAHKPKGIIGTYDMGDRFDERRNALVMWGEFLLDLAAGKPTEPAGTTNVVPLRKAGARR